MSWARSQADKALLCIAGFVVGADFVLPSYVTLFFDELILLACVWVMKKIKESQ